MTEPIGLLLLGWSVVLLVFATVSLCGAVVHLVHTLLWLFNERYFRWYLARIERSRYRVTRVELVECLVVLCQRTIRHWRMASKRRLRRHACERKVPYSTEGDAQQALAGMRRRGIQGNLAYRCEHCSHWHVGHPPARVRQSMADRRRQVARRG